MSGEEGAMVEAFLVAPGVAADHLYREGSNKASFWEAIFGSSLRAARRTHVSALADGTRVFDVPLLAVEEEVLRSALAWMTESTQAEACREAAAALNAHGIRVRLIGRQARGRAVAAFALRIEPSRPEVGTSPKLAEAFQAWFAHNGLRVARDTLIPFGFTPDEATYRAG